MDPLLATLALILLALLGARVSFSTQRVPAGPRLLFRTGAHFLLLGFLLGPVVLGLMSREAVAQLQPLLGVGLGWVGLHFGMQMDRAVLSRFPWSFFAVAVGQALLTFALFVVAGGAALKMAGFEGPSAQALLLGAAATAAISTPAGIAMVSANFLVRGNVRQLLFFVASLDGFVGIVALQVIYAVFHGTGAMADSVTGGWVFWIFAGVGLGLVCGIVFLWLVRLRPGREELVLYLLGISALAAGAALQLQMSPLFTSAVMGAVVANLAPTREQARINRNLERWEKPIYVILLLLAGVYLSFPTWWIAPLALGYALLRAAGKVVGNAALVSVVPLPFSTPRRFGLGLLPQGGISLAMALAFTLTLGAGTVRVNGVAGVEVLYAVVVLGVILSELVGPLFTVQVLRRAGEISPRVEQAIQEGDDHRARVEAMKRHEPAPPPSEQEEAP